VRLLTKMYQCCSRHSLSEHSHEMTLLKDLKSRQQI
jgi:hypothetical protein